MHGKLKGSGNIAMSANQTSPNLDLSYPVLILKMSPTPIHHGALAVARTLGRLGVRVYAVVEDGYTPLSVSRYLTKAFVWNECPTDPVSFVKAMSEVGQAIGRPTIVIPMDDLSAVTLGANAADLAQWFVAPPVSARLPHQLADKVSLGALCAELGIPSARSIVPNCIEDVRRFAESGRFPVVLKTAEQWHPIKNAFCTRVIKSPQELLDLCECCDFQGNRILIQEHIAGEDWITHGYYNSEKKTSLTFTGKKLCAYPSDAGSTAVGLSVDNEELRCETERLLNSVHYSGIIDMDWRKDERDGKYKILDCNPRVGQNFRMFENNAGVDVVRAQHLDLSGRRVDTSGSVKGRLFNVESFYMLARIRQLLAGVSKQGANKPAAINRTELAWWCSDDPVPFLVMALRVCIRLLGRALRFRLHSPLRLPLHHYSRPRAGADGRIVVR